MRTFWTEREIESYLKRETRQVRLPGGTRTSLTCFNLTWRNLDGLLYYGILTEEEISDSALKIARETGKSFQECFDWAVGYAFEAMSLVHYGGGIPAALTLTPAPRQK